ncbi:Dyp-type peroxidase [Streptomyces brasiliensis]|uniref:Peroxidase n=1 Tax=Streptomyces brasiliensis TaxID=1954 RepID=A0A917UP03_9ACTN|nr:Dyp-type peroxidase [Streptomyces brasiliensis]GGJ70982.1 peroxidase [Streptomyces brasiliensis]
MADSTDQAQVLELEDIQGTLLRQRPSPYTGTYFLLRVDDPAHGRQMLGRLLPHVASAARWWDPPSRAWLSVALSHSGLQALGVPQASLDSFPEAFREGMAARAERLGDTGESSPEHWDAPLGSRDVHIAVSVFAPDTTGLESLLEVGRSALRDLPGVQMIYRLEASQLPTKRTHLGFVDGIGEPDVEGAGVASILQAGRDHYGYLPGFGPTIKAGEFVLGYQNQLGRLTLMPQPDVLGRNGTYVAYRKLHLKVADFRCYLKDNSSSPEEEELLAAKMVGRWRSGAPLVLAPDHDDPDLAADPTRANDFTYRDQDPAGLCCPVGAHIRRTNPRDSLTDTIVDVRIHRALRRGTTYGPMLPEGQLEDDGAERGIVFIFMGADLVRQFEFLKTQWANDGDFVSLGTEKDPVIGNNDGTGTFTIPRRPVRRRLKQLPRFAITKGGEYLFMPGIRALTWITQLDT